MHDYVRTFLITVSLEVPHYCSYVILGTREISSTALDDSRTMKLKLNVARRAPASSDERSIRYNRRKFIIMQPRKFDISVHLPPFCRPFLLKQNRNGLVIAIGRTSLGTRVDVIASSSRKRVARIASSVVHAHGEMRDERRERKRKRVTETSHRCPR